VAKGGGYVIGAVETTNYSLLPPSLKYFLSPLNPIFFLVKQKGKKSHARHSFCQSKRIKRLKNGSL